MGLWQIVAIDGKNMLLLCHTIGVGVFQKVGERLVGKFAERVFDGEIIYKHA